MTDPRSFGAWLARERDRRGITLHAVAESTKIGTTRLAALERGDLSHWPGGIYRRAFVKAYADAVGLDAEIVLENFERAFPDPDAPPVAPQPRASEELRLQLEPEATVAGAPPSAWRRAAVDVLLIFAIAAAAYALGGITAFWCAAALASLACHLAGVLRLTWRPSESATSAPSRRTAAGDAASATPAA